MSIKHSLNLQKKKIYVILIKLCAYSSIGQSVRLRFWRLEVQIFLGTFWTFGEMSERLKERDWKSRICNSIVGSNPTLSERLISFYISYSGRLRQFLMNPPGSEGSNGKSIELGASLLVIRGFYFKKIIKSSKKYNFLWFFCNFFKKNLLKT